MEKPMISGTRTPVASALLAICAWAPCVLIVLAFFVPIGWWLLANDSHFRDILNVRHVGRVLAYTMLVSVATAIIATLLGLVIVLWTFQSSVARQSITLGLLLAPTAVGFLARNFAWIGIFSSPAARRARLDLLYTTIGVVTVLTSVFIPIGYFVILQGFRQIQRDHIDAAISLGVSPTRLITQLLIPMAKRSIYLSIAAIFTLSLGYFVTPQMIGGGRHDFVGNVVLRYFGLGATSEASTVAVQFLAVAIIPVTTLVALIVRHTRG